MKYYELHLQTCTLYLAIFRHNTYRTLPLFLAPIFIILLRVAMFKLLFKMLNDFVICLQFKKNYFLQGMQLPVNISLNMYTCMKNHEFMPDILVSPIFSQLSKREENKIFQRCSNLVIQRMQVLFLSSSQTFMHCQKLQDLIPI